MSFLIFSSKMIVSTLIVCSLFEHELNVIIINSTIKSFIMRKMNISILI